MNLNTIKMAKYLKTGYYRRILSHHQQDLLSMGRMLEVLEDKVVKDFSSDLKARLEKKSFSVHCIEEIDEMIKELKQ